MSIKNSPIRKQCEAEYGSLIEVLAGWIRHPDYPEIAGVYALTSDIIFTQSVLCELGSIQAPTLLIIGQPERTATSKARAPASVRESLGNYPQLGAEVGSVDT